MGGYSVTPEDPGLADCLRRAQISIFTLLCALLDQNISIFTLHQRYVYS